MFSGFQVGLQVLLTTMERWWAMENDSALPDSLPPNISALDSVHEETVFEKQAATLAELPLLFCAELGKVLAQLPLVSTRAHVVWCPPPLTQGSCCVVPPPSVLLRPPHCA